MTEVDELINQKKCHIQLQPVLSDINRVMAIWFNNPESDFNIEKNFVALQEQHSQYFDLVDEFSQSKLQTPNTLDDFKNAIESLGKEHTKIAQALGDVVLADERFVYSLDTLIIGLEKQKATLELIIKEYGYQELELTFDEIKSSIQTWIDKAIYLKNYILDANKKRSLLFGIVLDKLKLYLEGQFVQISGGELVEIENQLSSILAAADLLRDIENWWLQTALLKGFGEGYLTKYLQYEKPLFIMRSQYAEGFSFFERIQALHLPPDTHEFIVNELQGYLNTLNSEIEKLLAGGWQHQLERQMFLVAAREKILDRLSCQCKKAISNYKRDVINIQNLEEFRKAERLYKKVIDQCQNN